MSTTNQTLGDCPHCETQIPGHKLLIEYDTSEGRDRFAECPNCEDVVTPV